MSSHVVIEHGGLFWVHAWLYLSFEDPGGQLEAYRFEHLEHVFVGFAGDLEEEVDSVVVFPFIGLLI